MKARISPKLQAILADPDAGWDLMRQLHEHAGKDRNEAFRVKTASQTYNVKTIDSCHIDPRRKR